MLHDPPFLLHTPFPRGSRILPWPPLLSKKRNVSVKDASPIPGHAAVTRAITVTTAPELKPGFLLAHA